MLVDLPALAAGIAGRRAQYRTVKIGLPGFARFAPLPGRETSSDTGAYGAVFPDLPGCYSGGETLDDVLRNSLDAVHLWAEDVRQGGQSLPVPRSLETLRADEDVVAAMRGGALLAIVPLLLNSGQTMRANLSLDSGLLAAIDAAAMARGLTRSAFMASAAREKIESDR